MEIQQEVLDHWKRFVKEIEEIVTYHTAEEEITERVSKKLKSYLNSGLSIPNEYTLPNPDKYVLYPLYIAPDESFSISSAVWDVGQSTPIHNHGVWGVIGIVDGKEREVQFLESRIEGGELDKVGERFLHKGDVTVCCSKDLDIHKVNCASDTPCIGIHIYGGNIGTKPRYVYDRASGEKKEVITPWSKSPLISEI
ncbi:cysteine dioxygenase family protein [Alteribacillus iranensis]|nr:hypothetical protein [Alteribacillus iranensis]